MLEEKVIYRKATLEDLAILLRFEQEIIKAERPFDETLKDDPIIYYDLKELIKSEASEVIVAAHGTEIIGSGYALIKNGRPYLKYKNYAYLGCMYTAPSYRGKGVNKKIIEVLKEWAKTKNLTEVRLTVYDGNFAAIKAYEKAGFKKHIIEMRIGIDA